LQVQKSEKLDPSAWVTFQASIEGFAFEPGYVYKILVRERQFDANDHSEDSPSAEYILVEILEKKQDKKFRINGNWVLHKIKEETMLAHSEDISPPELVINVGEMRYGGNDGCNNFNGGLVEIGDRMIRFGIAATTRMMCPHMKIPDLFSTCLSEVRSWEVKENRLQLYDAEGSEVMQLRNMDQ
jgi:heat shock protein HslJ